MTIGWKALPLFFVFGLFCFGLFSLRQAAQTKLGVSKFVRQFVPHAAHTEPGAHEEFRLLPSDELLPLEAGLYDVKLLEYYASRAGVYVEFGSGGSTTLATALAGRVYSVENAAPWCNKMTNNTFLSRAIDQGVLTFTCAAPAPVVVYGMPKHKADYGKFVPYITAPDTYGLQDTKADVIFVDGRFRAACALNAMRYMKESSVLLIHDFWFRESYRVVLKYYDVSFGCADCYRMWRHLLDRHTLEEVLSRNLFTGLLSETERQNLSGPFKDAHEAAKAITEVFTGEKRRAGSININNGTHSVEYRHGYSTMVVLKLKPQYLVPAQQVEMLVPAQQVEMLVDLKQNLEDPRL